MVKNYKLQLKYDGTKYSGWQIQPHAKTIQGEVLRALGMLSKEPVELIGVSRTDAGVHALAYICNCKINTEAELNVIFRSLNGILDKDIRVTDISICDDNFNARHDALAKTYIYTIDNTPYGEPFLRQTAWRWGKKLDFEIMKKAAASFIGTHDFSAFMSSGSSATDFVRTIYNITLKEENSIITMEITGNAFLYNMVRIITGTLVLVGNGKIQPENVADIILKKDRKLAGMTAPPQGLALKKVYYGEEELKCLLKNSHSLKE